MSTQPTIPVIQKRSESRNFNSLPPLLAKNEEKQLGEDLLHGTDEQKDAAKCRLVEANIRLVIKIAGGYSNLGVEVEDLINEGNMGLMVAAEKFDPTRGAKFSTYSSFWIRQRILRALTDKGSLIRLPAYLKQKYLNIRKFMAEYKLRNNEPPTNEQIAKKFEITASKVEKLLEITAPILRLDGSVLSEAGEEWTSTWGDFTEDSNTPSPLIILEFKQEAEDLSKMISHLPHREEYIIRHRFGLDGSEKETLEKIGEKFGVTRERIRQVEKAALAKLQSMYRSRKLLTKI